MNAIEYLKGCQAIQKVLLELHVEATLSECQDFWRWRSSQWDANWLVFHDDCVSLKEDAKEWLKGYWDATGWPDSEHFNPAYYLEKPCEPLTDKRKP